MGGLTVLLSAFACLPGRGSEPGKAWACANTLARDHTVWVLTRGQNRLEIEASLAQHPVANLKFVYVQLPAWMLALQRNKEFSQITYYLWQIAAFLRARRLLRHVDFDIAHHVTFSKYWVPSFLVFLPVPLIWGPVGGGESTPRGFWGGFSLRGKVYEVLRTLARWLGERDPFLKLTARRSALVLATSEESRRRLAQLRPARLEIYPAIGLMAEDIDQLRATGLRDAGPLRFLSIGRLLHWKGFHLGLQAFAEADLAGAEYWIIGDGAELGRLKLLAERLGIAERVVFLGHLSRDQTLQRLAECDVLVHPSLHESGGLTCLEAMAARRPVLCLDLGGPALQVSDDTGIRVGAHDPGQAVAGLAAGMAKLAGDPELRHRIGEAGTDRVARHYVWDHKVAFYVSIYKEIVAERKRARGPERTEDGGILPPRDAVGSAESE